MVVAHHGNAGHRRSPAPLRNGPRIRCDARGQRRRGRPRKNLFINPRNELPHAAPREQLVDAGDCLAAHAVHQSGLAKKFRQPGSHGIGVVRRHQESRAAMFDRVLDAAHSEPTTGVPQAIASSGVMPKGSYQGVVAKTSAAVCVISAGPAASGGR